MKDIFVTRHRDDFVSLMTSLCDSLQETLPSESDVAKWCASMHAALEKDADAVLATWYAGVTTRLTRAHAKYARAVESIASGATLYHAIHYCDAPALQSCHALLAPVDTTALVAAFSSKEDTTLFWRYLVELSDACYRWKQVAPPRVPTVEEIDADIRARKQQRKDGGGDGGSGSSGATRGLGTGVADLWAQLTSARGASACALDDARRERLRALLNHPLTSDRVVAAFPELGNAPYGSDGLNVLERIKNLSTMDDAIPTNMMKGIESMASKIVSDIQQGTCDLASLDIECIGQQVIAGVSDKDIGDFAANLDKIIPALERVQPR